MRPLTRRAFLGHLEEDLAGLAVRVQADGDVALVAGDVELVGDRGALGREPAAMRACVASTWASASCLRRLSIVSASLGAAPLVLLLAGGQRLGALAAVAVDRDRLEAELPALEVDRLDLLGRGRLGHVHGLADRAREERLDRGHHPDVAHVVDGPLAVDRLERAVEDRQVLRLEARRAFDRLVLVDVGDDLLDLVRAE